MCGIAGVYLHAGQEAGADTLQRLAAALAHRGPDGTGRYRHGRIGLAHTRLSIIDLETGQQPLYNADKTLCLIANGEIYNYIELRKELEQQGCVFSTRSDCETILHAYARYGLDFVTRLHGMFAFALYDARQQRLILARDRLGIKPLFITRQPEGWLFASEIKALLAVLRVKPEINPAGLAQYLQTNFTCGAATLLQGIERVLPGEMIALGPQGVELRKRYWTPARIQPAQLNLTQALEQFDALISDVMREHMRSDVPFGLFLSGGVDSSILLALLSRAMREPLRTYSVGFPETSVNNELPVAARVAREFGAEHTALQLDSNALLQRLPLCLWAADELMGDYASLPTLMLAERAARDLKVVFTGEGGDEVFAGYGRYRTPLLKRLFYQLRAPGSGGFRTRGVFSRVHEALFNPELTQAMQSWRTPFIETWQSAPREWSTLQRMQQVDMETWLPNDLLVKADRMLMAHGVEGRVPFLDHRVVEFGLSLPDHLKVSGKNGKVFLKHWAERFFPGEHLWSRKRGFTVPVRDWLRGERLQRLQRVLPAHPAIRRWCDAAAVQRLLAAQERSGNFSQPLWSLLQFAVWHTLFIEGNGARPADECDPLSLIG
ncbi:MAG: asparagine synthase (glutamine-hydrolyzing) [Gammaproteobacteria bacterium]